MRDCHRRWRRTAAGPIAGGAMLGVLALSLVVPAVRAADPRITRVAPAGAQRGTEVEVQIAGSRLADAKEILLYEPGIAVKSVEPEKPDRVKVGLALSGDCRLGPHAFRLRTASGVSNLITFSVGALAEVVEAEPNNEFDKPQAIALGSTVNGVVQNEDVDYFAVEAKKGDRVSVEIEGLRLGETFFDPYVAILNSRRFVLAGSDDTPLVRQDAVAAIVADADGRYVIEVRESSFGGSARCRYRLHVGAFPRPLAVYPAGGKPGQAMEVRWLGDPAGEWSEKITLPQAASAEFGLLARDPWGVAPSANAFRLVALDNVLETEPNNALGEANAFPGAAALNGRIEQPGDVDCFTFAAKKGQAYDLRVFARQLRSPLDSVLQVRRKDGANVGSNDDSGGPDSFYRFKAPEDDEYVISIVDQLQQGGPEYVYRIEVTPVEPKLTMGLPERQSFVDTTISVPQGNRTAAVVSAQRADFGGDVAVDVRGVPQGVSVEAVPITADQSRVPVLFSAAADAPLSAALAEVIGRHTAGKSTVEGGLRQRTSLVRGQNNREVWNQYTERMAMAVTEAVPFSIEIVQPKAPLVQNGSMQLKIVAKRAEGFKAPITLKMLYNPPGVASPTSVAIPEGKSEALIPLTANGSAKIRPWKIAVTGQSDTGGGNVLVSTQLATLEVSPPFFKFSFPTVSVEQGQEVELAVGIEQVKEFAGQADVQLVGLPNEVTSPAKKISKDDSEVVFAIATTAKSPPGNHKVLRCRAVVTAEGEPVTHMLGTGELRIFKPLPQKKEPAAQPKPETKPAAKKPASKRLSRLEKLRLAREEKKKAG